MTSYLHEQPTMNAHTFVPAMDWKWKWCLGGDWSIAFHVLAAPNVFQRWLLRALLGIHWERLP